MKIELLALLDLIEILIKSDNTQPLHEDTIQSQLKKFKEVQLIRQIWDEINNNNYSQALELVSGYRFLCKELLSIYNCLTKDYLKLKDDHFTEEVETILNEKYGIGKIREVISLLELKQNVKTKPEVIGFAR